MRTSPSELAAQLSISTFRYIARALALACAITLVPGRADDGLRFAIVVPAAGSPFFEAVEAGCVARAVRIAADRGPITCLYVAAGVADPASGALAKPAEQSASGSSDPSQPSPQSRSEAQIILDLVAGHIDGIAVSPTDDPAVAAAIEGAAKSAIPVVTFDADAASRARSAFIGTNARDFGRALGASLKRWKPRGGKFAIVSTDPQQPNMAERIYGVRDEIGPGWAEITDSPLVTTGDFRDAIAKIDHLLNSYYDVDAIISVGAWPMLATDAWRDMISRYKSRIDQADVVLVVADALPEQKELVRQGLGHVLVGQKPADMGALALDLLFALKSGRKVPEVNYVGFETFTRLDLVGRSN
jgi:ribose transport system substrate-binding protein